MTFIQKANFIKEVFAGGVKNQLKQEWTWAGAAAMGLQQGLKYKGSIKTGVLGGLATLAVLAGASGVYNVISNWDNIQEYFKKAEAGENGI